MGTGDLGRGQADCAVADVGVETSETQTVTRGLQFPGEAGLGEPTAVKCLTPPFPRTPRRRETAGANSADATETGPVSQTRSLCLAFPLSFLKQNHRGHGSEGGTQKQTSSRRLGLDVPRLCCVTRGPAAARGTGPAEPGSLGLGARVQRAARGAPGPPRGGPLHHPCPGLPGPGLSESGRFSPRQAARVLVLASDM